MLLRGALLLFAISLALVLTLRVRSPRGPFFVRLLTLLIIAWCVEVVGPITAHYGMRNVLMYNIYAVVEFLLLLDMVRVLRSHWRRPLLVVGLTGLLAMAFAFMRKSPTDHLAVEGLLVLGVLHSSVSLWLLVDMARTSQWALWRIPAFWLFTGSLLYFGGTIPVLGAWLSIAAQDPRLAMTMYWIVGLLATVRYLLIALAGHFQHVQVQRSRPWTPPS